MSDWYSTGREGLDAEAQRKISQDKPRRFWMPKDSSSEVVFLDDASFNVYEYQWRANDTWTNWATQSSDPEVDVIFRSKNLRPYFCAFRTVVNCNEWTDAQGNHHQYQIQLLPAKTATAELIERRRKKLETLTGRLFNISRGNGTKSASSGDDYEFDRDVDLEKLYSVAVYKGKKFSEWVTASHKDPQAADYLKQKFAVELDENGLIVPKLVPFNYMELLKPPSLAEAKRIMAGVGASGGRNSRADEEVPF